MLCCKSPFAFIDQIFTLKRWRETMASGRRPMILAEDLVRSMEELRIRGVEEPLFREALRRTCAKGSSAHNLPISVDEKSLLRAIQEVEERVWQMRK